MKSVTHEMNLIGYRIQNRVCVRRVRTLLWDRVDDRVWDPIERQVAERVGNPVRYQVSVFAHYRDKSGQP